VKLRCLYDSRLSVRHWRSRGIERLPAHLLRDDLKHGLSAESSYRLGLGIRPLPSGVGPPERIGPRPRDARRSRLLRAGKNTRLYHESFRGRTLAARPGPRLPGMQKGGGTSRARIVWLWNDSLTHAVGIEQKTALSWQRLSITRELEGIFRLRRDHRLTEPISRLVRTAVAS